MRKFDVVIIGGGVIGSAAAFFLANEPAFAGSIAVVERDPTYGEAATPRSAGGIRQQFSTPENIQISQFAAAFIKNIGTHLSTGGEKPDVNFRENGYLFMATGSGLKTLLENQRLQRQLGAQTELMTPEELQARFPWLHVADLAGGAFGPKDEGWIDPYSLLQAFRRKAQSLGVTYINGTVTGLDMNNHRVAGVTLQSGERLACGAAINCAGVHAAEIASMAGIHLPVRPRKRFVYLFDCRTELPGMPLTVEPNGVWFRPEGLNYIVGVSPGESEDPDTTDFELDYRLFEEIIWPTLAHRVPAFESIKLIRAWAGHYDYNTLDQNVIIGPAPQAENFYLANGFSGHGLQQAPAIGRALSELLAFGQYRTIDLSRFSYQRVLTGLPVREANVV